MRPLIAALAVLLAAAPLTGFASDIASRGREMKGARAVLVDGPGLDAQIRVVDLREATPLSHDRHQDPAYAGRSASLHPA